MIQILTNTEVYQSIKGQKDLQLIHHIFQVLVNIMQNYNIKDQELDSEVQKENVLSTTL